MDPAKPLEKPNAWRCYRACLGWAPVDATHLLVLQDDAILCPYFPEAAAAALEARPDRIVSFFVAGAPRRSVRAVTEAAGRCAHWAELDPTDWVPVVALCLPCGHARDLAIWADEQTFPDSMTSDDAIVGDWVRARGLTVAATVPSLVDHDDAVPSVMGNAHTQARNPVRVAACFVGGYDARRIRW